MINQKKNLCCGFFWLNLQIFLFHSPPVSPPKIYVNIKPNEKKKLQENSCLWSIEKWDLSGAPGEQLRSRASPGGDDSCSAASISAKSLSSRKGETRAPAIAMEPLLMFFICCLCMCVNQKPVSSFPPPDPISRHPVNSMGESNDIIHQSGSFKRLMYHVLGETDY